MKFSNCLKLAMVVGLAASAASASDRIALQPITGISPVFKGYISMQDGTISQYGSRALTTFTAYDNDPVVDGTPGVVDTTNAPADYFFAGLAANVGDYVTLDRRFSGRGIFGDTIKGNVDSLVFGISYLGAGADTPVDSYHLFADDLVTWDSFGSLTDITRGTATGFYFADLAAPDINSCGCFYIYAASGIASAIPIEVDDNFLVYWHWISLAGSGGTPITDANGLTVYNGDGSGTGTDGGNYVGASIDLFLYDGDGSGAFNDPEWLYYYGGTPAVANLYLGLGIQQCDADQDGSGFADTDDFDAYVAAFEAGC